MIERYQDPEIERIFSFRNKLRWWRRVELEVARAQEKLGQIPEGTARRLEATLVEELVRTTPILERDTRHDFVAFLQAWRTDQMHRPGDAMNYLHHGLTSSDVEDTALSKQLKQANEMVWNWTQLAIDELDVREAEFTSPTGAYRRVARTHGQWATVGELPLLFSRWSSHLHRTRYELASGSFYVAKISGPAGDYSTVDGRVASMVATELGLVAVAAEMQCVPRDRIARLANALAGVATACSQIALDFRLLALSDVGEVAEGFAEGQRGSSSMPHKRNPITAEKICGVARLARGYASMLQPWELWLERDISHSSVERVAIPDLYHVVCHALRCTRDLVRDAQIDAKRMETNARKAGSVANSALEVVARVAAGEEREEVEQELRNHNHD